MRSSLSIPYLQYDCWEFGFKFRPKLNKKLEGYLNSHDDGGTATDVFACISMAKVRSLNKVREVQMSRMYRAVLARDDDDGDDEVV